MQIEKLPQNYMTNPYELYDDFSTSTWRATNPTITTVTEDTTKVVTGTKSLKLTTNATAMTSCTLDRQGVDLSFVGKSKQIMIKAWFDDPTLIDSFIFTLGTSDWSKYFNASFYGNNFRPGWNYFLVNPSKENYVGDLGVSYGGGFDWSQQLGKMQFTIKPKTSTPASVTIDSIWLYGKGIPKILITFDDGWKTVYENAYPIMKKYGIPGTIYVIPKYSSPDSDRYEWFSSVEEFKEMYNDGWCIANHTFDHTYYYGDKNTHESYAQKIKQCADWLLEKGFGEGAYHIAYPNGEHPPDIGDTLRAIGMKTGRTTKKGVHSHIVDDYFRAWTRGVGYVNSLEQVKGWVDQALECGGTTFFMFHQIPLDDTTRNGRENPDISWSKDKFIALMEYIAERGAAQYCVGQDEWYEGMTNARYRNKRI